MQSSFQRQLLGLAREFSKKFRQPLVFTDTVRTYAEQAKVYREKPSLALPADHPNAMHPRGLAVDVDSKQAALLSEEMLARYGLHRPALSKGETWHLEPEYCPRACRSAGDLAASSPKSTAALSMLLRGEISGGKAYSQVSGLSGPTSIAPVSDRRRLFQVAREVEALFLEKLLQQTRRSMVEPLTSPGHKQQGYLSLADQQLARSLAAAGGIGLAAKILSDLAPAESSSPREVHHGNNSSIPGYSDKST
ncbi:MAG: hypothetical protein ACUVXF_04960 [Desulfobaccales bacterium]